MPGVPRGTGRVPVKWFKRSPVVNTGDRDILADVTADMLNNTGDLLKLGFTRLVDSADDTGQSH